MVLLSVCGARPGVGSPQKAASDGVLAWHRDGGFAGFCDALEVSAAGEARATSCRSAGAAKSAALSREDRSRLDRWRSSFGDVSIEVKDSGAADSMVVTLKLKGNGTAHPTQAEQQEMLNWAERIYTQNRP